MLRIFRSIKHRPLTYIVASERLKTRRDSSPPPRLSVKLEQQKQHTVIAVKHRFDWVEEGI